MKGFLRFICTTLAGGILFLVPIVVIAVILEKALNLAHKVAAPLAERLPIESVVGLRTALLLAVAVLVLFCFLTGLFARSALAQRFVAWLETTVLSNLPGYEFFKSLGESMLGVEPAETRPVVLAHLDDAWQIGFLVGRLDNGLVAVFVPDAPNPHTGAICYMLPENITATDLTPAAAVKLLRRLGSGANAAFGQTVVPGAKPADACKSAAPAMD
ncbi:MAG: DUF502 domain-containing protein [Lacunisphaera sp.]